MSDLNPSIDGLFVPKLQEQNYTKAHNMRFSRLDNGIKLLSAFRNDSESVTSKIEVDYAVGSWFDPKSKKGLHHLLEHLLNPSLRKYQTLSDCKVNASTSAVNLVHYLEGPAHYKHNDYGVWLMLEPVYSQLRQPLDSYSDLEATIKQEKQIVMSEINHRFTDHVFIVKDTLMQKFYSQKNPLIDSPLGDFASLGKITALDIKKVSKNLLHSKDLIISSEVDYNEATMTLLHEKLQRLWQEFPQYSDPNLEINREDFNLLAGSVEKGVTFHRSGINNKVATVVLSWLVDFEAFSAQRYGLYTLIERLRTDFFKLSRDKGWGYRQDIAFTTLTETKGLVHFLVDIAADSNDVLEEKTSEITKQVQLLMTLDPKTLNSLVKLQRKRKEVWPLSITTKFAWQKYVLRNFDRLIDTDQVILRQQQLSEEHLNFWLTFFKQEKPYTTVIGDVSLNT